VFLAYGKISEVLADKGLYRVTFDDRDMVSRPLPRVFLNTKKNKDEASLDENEHVACIMDENFEDGVILGAIYDANNLPPVGSIDKRVTTYDDGSFVQFDRVAKKLTISCEGNVEIIKATDINITASGTIKFNDGSNEGIPKVVALASKIAAVETLVNNILTVLKATTIPLAPSGTYPFAALYAALSVIAPITSQASIEDTKVKH